MLEFHEYSNGNVVRKAFNLLGRERYTFDTFSQREGFVISFRKKTFDKFGCELRNHYFGGRIVGRREYVSNRIESYQNMPKYRDFHGDVLELTIDFDIDDRSAIEADQVSDINMIIKRQHIDPHSFGNERKEVFLRDKIINTLYLYYTLFV